MKYATHGQWSEYQGSNAFKRGYPRTFGKRPEPMQCACGCRKLVIENNGQRWRCSKCRKVVAE